MKKATVAFIDGEREVPTSGPTVSPPENGSEEYDGLNQ
jgi:hypothetical protein